MNQRYWIAPLCLVVLLLLPLPAETTRVGDLASQVEVPAEVASRTLSSPAAREACSLTQAGWTIERPDSPKDFGPQGSRTLALDTAGHPHIAYGGDHLYYAWHDGTTWHRETVDPAIGVGAYASLALDTAGHPHISYYDDLKDDVRYAYFDGTSWQIEVVDPNLGDS